jgi:L-asparaginase II
MAKKPSEANPVLVEVTRGGMVESRHRGVMAVVDSSGRLVAGWGDVDAPTFPRSSVKPLQAVPLVESGAADAFAVTSSELALACASHAGEALHVQCVAAWLRRLGLDVEDLVCGPHPPLDQVAATDLILKGEQPTRLHNNCSGKHAGFLTVAQHLGLPPDGYADPDHPVQRRVLAVLAEMTGVDVSRAVIAVDGCGAPVMAISIRQLAQGFSFLAGPDRLPAMRGAAVRRVCESMISHPPYIGGTNRFDTLITEAGGGAILTKRGAEGVACAALRDSGLGIALKIDDGGKRAAGTALAALLLRFSPADGRLRHTLEQFSSVALRNTSGQEVGVIRSAACWPD